MVNKADFKFGMISVVLESDETKTDELSNIAYDKIMLLIPEAKIVVREEREAMAKNMKLLKGKAECDSCEDDCECGEDETACPHKKNDDLKNLYV